jgi:hypothetical protein
VAAAEYTYSCNCCYNRLLITKKTTFICTFRRMPGFRYLLILCPTCRTANWIPAFQSVLHAERRGCLVHESAEEYPPLKVIVDYERSTGCRVAVDDVPLSTSDESSIAFLRYLLERDASELLAA